MLPRCVETVEVIVAALHHAAVDVLQPQAVSGREEQAYYY